MFSFSQFIKENKTVLYSPESASELKRVIEGDQEITPIPLANFQDEIWKTSGIVLNLKPQKSQCSHISDYVIADVMVFGDTAKTEFRSLRLDRKLPVTYLDDGTSVAAILSIIGE